MSQALFNRSFGVLLHPTSLPSGRLGPDAYAFVDWLAAAGAGWWQLLPLNPPDAFESPYASTSAFACWRGLLAEPDAPVTTAEIVSFSARESYWLPDWQAYAGEGAAADQVRFEREWQALRAYAAERGVRLLGDVPIYVAKESCDHLAHPELFLPHDLVAGAPPDSLDPRGQKWGNPLYDWDALAADGYRWWIERMRRVLDLVDVFRIDHFRAFAGFWAVPAAGESTEGAWRPGPGAALFRAAERELGPLPVVAEDLGVITPDVHALRDELGFPGMAVLLWGVEYDDERSPHRLENHRENQVVYTSTHDTEPLAAFFPDHDPWDLIELAFSSRAALAIVPMQDVLALGSQARMNRPGDVGGNWAWRLEPGQLSTEQADWLRAAAEASGRVVKGVTTDQADS
jgi:4-alpha-glucanotransferase